MRVEIERDWDSFREAARGVLRRGVYPRAVHWAVRGETTQENLLAVGRQDPPGDGEAQLEVPRLPRSLLRRMRLVSLHRSPDRFDLLYRLLWRVANRELDPRDELDEDSRDVRRRAAQVRRDAHKATAFVRFRKVEERDDAGEPQTRWVAWHRPDHYVAALVGPFFAERFADRAWAILMPDESLAFEPRTGLTQGPGQPRSAAPSADQLEELWKTYYRSIFNPSRLKLRAMTAEMPKRYWATLPEASLIHELSRTAEARRNRMVAAGERALLEKPPAQLLVDSTSGLDDLESGLDGCRACPLWSSATRPVFGEGDPEARVLLLGEQPGDEEDQAGRPFVGPAGQLLDEILEEIGIDRRTLWLTNVVKHFKFQQRGKRRIHQSPSTVEVSSCFPIARAEIERVSPERIVCLGATASRAILGAAVKLTQDRGCPREARLAPWVLPTWHPAAVLRHPDASERARKRSQLRDDLKLACA